MTSAQPARQRRLTPTRRGTGVAIAAATMLILGIGFGSAALTYLAVATTAAVLVAWVWVAVIGISLPSRLARVSRAIGPQHAMVNVPAFVTTSMTATRWNATSHMLIRGLGVSEQAAAEITGTAHQRAAVTRGERALTLTYPIRPTQRGWWTLGPCMVATTDPWGLVNAECSVGATDTVAVWPAVVDLVDVARAVMGVSEHRSTGVVSAQADDSSLREYRQGDDLRRVHWASSARRQTMLVRHDEHEGKRPATVILDLPGSAAAAEWAISAAASIASAVLETGHEAVTVGAGLSHDPSIAATGNAERERLLDSLAALEARPIDRVGDPTGNVGDAAAIAADRERYGAVTFAIMGAPPEAALADLARLGHSGSAWAVIVDTAARGTQSATDALRAAGWRVVVANPHEPVGRAWQLLAGEAAHA
ncbi:DUF58 domain-containing protein [Demequina globuliformis]|uniref:DUF58 domain-containing protein n=1 Tax=Demequina globuliformis TaxID=676202 RepID=UPI00078525CD|nr:DUF58 domain-containing protein [Demequina globuliformis]